MNHSDLLWAIYWRAYWVGLPLLASVLSASELSTDEYENIVEAYLGEAA